MNGWTIESLINDLKKEPFLLVTTRDGKAMNVHTLPKARYPGFDIQWFNAPGFKDKFKALGGGVGKDSAGEWSLIKLWESADKPVVEQKAPAPVIDDITIIPADVTKILKPSQIPAVAHLVSVLKHNAHALDASGTGVGKAQPLDAKILTPEGWKQMGDFKIGDFVFSNDGKPYPITKIYPQGEKDIFKVVFSDGSWTECTEDHLWAIRSRKQKYRKKDFQILSLMKIREILKDSNGDRTQQIPMTLPVEFPERTLPLDPYLLGALIGNGMLGGGNSTQNVIFSTSDQDTLEFVKDALPEGYELLYCGNDSVDYRIVRINRNEKYEKNIIKEILASLGLQVYSENKFIPEVYKFASVSQRIALLQGLLDTDGSIDSRNSVIEYSTSSEILANDVQFLVNTLGGKAIIKSRIPKFTYKGETKTGLVSYRVYISLSPEISPFRCIRKASRYIPRSKYLPVRVINSIEPCGRKACQCIAVNAPNNLYLTDFCIVTHNTYMACAAVKTLGLKAVVIGPKNSLPKWRLLLEQFNVDMIALTNYDLARLAEIPVRRASTRAKTGFVVEHQDAPFLKIGPPVNQSRFTWNLPDDAIVIFDEAHKCKNKSAINTELLIAATNQKIKTLLLSATIGESPMKLYAIAHNLGLYPRLRDFYIWGLKFGCAYIDVNAGRRGLIRTYDFTGGTADLVRLHDVLFPAYGIRLRPEDIPEFPETLIMAEVVDMNSNAAKIQTAYLKMHEELEKLRQAKATDSTSELTIRLRARQKIELLKVPTLVEMAEDLIDSKNAVVIFVNFSDTVRALMKELKTDCVIWGEQSSDASDERERNRQAFQDDKTHVIICNLASGGQSIDLHDMHGNWPRVSLITPSDSAQDVKQALGRIQRMGGVTKSVQKIIFCADTVEEAVAENVQKKIENIDALNDGDLTGEFSGTKDGIFVDVFCTRCGARIPKPYADEHGQICPACIANAINVSMVCIRCKALISEETAVNCEMMCEKCFAGTEPQEDELRKMPAPRVELEDGIYEKDGTIYKVIRAIYGSGHKYAKKFVQKSDGTWHFVFESKAISILAPENRMTLEAAKSWGKLYGFCCACGRRLTDETSIELGIGPICRGKFL